MPTILLIGAFDTKGPEYQFLRRQIVAGGCEVVAVNTGTLGTTDLFPVEVEAGEVARAAGGDIAFVRQKQDRGEAMKLMSAGAAAVVRRLYEQRKFDGVIGMGGTGGSSVVAAAMRALPIGIPKLMVSTLASGQVRPWVGDKDICMLNSVVDIAGINRISRKILGEAAAAMAGMVNALKNMQSAIRNPQC